MRAGLEFRLLLALDDVEALLLLRPRLRECLVLPLLKERLPAKYALLPGEEAASVKVAVLAVSDWLLS